jgi:uroporphyrinogen-III synthase
VPTCVQIPRAIFLCDAARAVLVTRPLPAAEETVRRIAALGLRPVMAPLLVVRRLPGDLPRDAAAVLITSGNAVESLPGWARDRPVFAVGDATAARARHAGWPTVHSAGGDAADLAALVDRMLPADAPGGLLLLTGKGQGHALADRLRARQRQVIRREVYEAAPVPTLPVSAAAALRGGELRAVLIFSAETGRQFVRLVAADGLETSVCNADACAISQAAGVALEPLPWRRIRIAVRPTQDDMLALLQ